MKTIRYFVPVLALVGTAACKDLNVPNYNAQSISELQQGANAGGVAAAAVGVLALSREFETSTLVSHIALTGTFGREGMELDPSNPQHPVDRLDQIGTSEPSYAGWSAAYRTIKQANVLLDALGTATGLTDAQKEGVRGFAKTMQALTFIRLLIVFDQAGLPIDVNIETSASPAAIATKAQVQARISTLLDEAKTHLQAAGTSFSFGFPAGFVGQTQGAAFNTPAQFLKFNRALKARIEVYRGSDANRATAGSGAANYTAALTAIGESFIDQNASIRFGAYDSYSDTPGDRQNPMFDPTCRLLFGMPELETGAKLQPGGAADARFTTKVRKITPKVVHTITVNSCFNLYPTSATPVPIIRNEELTLLRAEARYFTGDVPGALDDINYIRTTAGGLATLAAFASQTEFEDELLYNRLYSLIWEGGHRWVDMRRFNRLAQLPRALTRHKIFPYIPLPADECLPRGNPAASCNNPAGI